MANPGSGRFGQRVARGLGNSCSIRILFPMVIGKRIRLTDWGRQYGLDPQSTWRMCKRRR